MSEFEEAKPGKLYPIDQVIRKHFFPLRLWQTKQATYESIWGLYNSQMSRSPPLVKIFPRTTPAVMRVWLSALGHAVDFLPVLMSNVCTSWG